MSTLRVDPAELHAAVRQAYAAAQEVSPLVRAIEQALTDSFVRSDEAAQYAQSAGCPWTRGVARVLDAPSSTKGFDKVGAWVRADGSPWSGWDAQLEVQVGLGCLGIVLANRDLERLDPDFRVNLARACYYLVVRHIGVWQARKTEWLLWLSALACLRPELLEGLPFSVSDTGERWRGLPVLELSGLDAMRWRGIAFRACELAVVVGPGLCAIGGPNGCEWYDGRQRVACIRGRPGDAWRLEGARSSEKEASFRLVNALGHRLLLRGGQGRLALVAESTERRPSLRVSLDDGLTDCGPRQFQNDTVRVLLDRQAAWRFERGWWYGELDCPDVPNRTRLSCAPVGK